MKYGEQCLSHMIVDRIFDAAPRPFGLPETAGGDDDDDDNTNSTANTNTNSNTKNMTMTTMMMMSLGS